MKDEQERKAKQEPSGRGGWGGRKPQECSQPLALHGRGFGGPAAGGPPDISFDNFRVTPQPHIRAVSSDTQSRLSPLLALGLVCKQR